MLKKLRNITRQRVPYKSNNFHRRTIIALFKFFPKILACQYVVTETHSLPSALLHHVTYVSHVMDMVNTHIQAESLERSDDGRRPHLAHLINKQRLLFA